MCLGSGKSSVDFENLLGNNRFGWGRSGCNFQPFSLSLPLTGSFLRAPWGIPYGVGSTSYFRAFLPAGRSRDSPLTTLFTLWGLWCLAPSLSRGLLPRSPCPHCWPHAGVFVLSPEPQWLPEHLWRTGWQRELCSLPCSCFTCHDWAAHEWKKGMHLGWKMWFWKRGSWYKWQRWLRG